jgi:Iap family predicted aminopeptidase
MLRRLTVLSLAFAAPVFAQKSGATDSAKVISAPVHGGLRVTAPTDAKRILGALAADSMEGRATGTAGAHRAARYIASEMQRIGLQSLGDSGFFQKIPVAMTPPASGRSRPRLLSSFADLDTVPQDRRRTEVNVLGVIRGSDPVLRDEIVLIDGHYDHLGIVKPAVAGGDSIANGADDDASGITAVLEIARQMKEGPRPKRTVVFAAMVGEEVGLVGTNWYINHPAFPLEKMVANLEIEMIDRPDSLAYGAGNAWLTGFERSNMGELFQAAGLKVFPDARPSQNFFSRSDNIGFARRGIVAHTLSSFDLHKDYHHVDDEVGKADFAHMATVINTAARAVRLLADGPRPEWKAGGQPVAGGRRGGN